MQASTAWSTTGIIQHSYYHSSKAQALLQIDVIFAVRSVQSMQNNTTNTAQAAKFKHPSASITVQACQWRLHDLFGAARES